MKRIGLTGNIGTGKSTAARIFEILGIPVYHADIEARKLLDTKTVVEQIGSLFGPDVLISNQQVDRKALAAIVFVDKDKLTLLNSVIHPLVENHFEAWCKQYQSYCYIVHEAAILFESGFDKLFESTILVTAPEELCILRVTKRDMATTDMVIERMQNQWSQESKLKLAQYVIINDEIEMLIPQVLAIHRKILDS